MKNLKLKVIFKYLKPYKKAIDAAPGVASYHFTRARLLEQIGDRRGSIRCYRRLLGELGEGQGEQFIQV